MMTYSQIDQECCPDHSSVLGIMTSQTIVGDYPLLNFFNFHRILFAQKGFLLVSLLVF